MDTPKKSGPNLQAWRKFVKNTQVEWPDMKFTESKIKEILKESGFNAFVVESTPLYQAALMAYREHIFEEMRQARIADLLSKVNLEKPGPYTCPVCGAEKVSDRIWGWICQVGGLRHRLASIHYHTKETQEEFLKRMEGLDDQKEQSPEKEEGDHPFIRAQACNTARP